MQRKFVVPVDLANEDPPELQHALELARALGAEILLLHVIDYVPMFLPVELPGGYPALQLDLVREAVQDKLDRLAKKLAGVPSRTLVEAGSAAAEIVNVARREHADQIILGSHSKAAVARLVLGSVADRVAHTAPCPVTIVRHKGAQA